MDLIRGFMGQVPQNSYLLIGSGALARHLDFYFSQLKLNFRRWNRSSGTDESLLSLLKSSTHILLAISDSAIPGFYQSFQSQAPMAKWIHFSGSLSHPPMISAHPLMSFGPDRYAFEFYKKIYFTVTGTMSLQDLFPELPNPSGFLPESKKSFYHAMCVLGGNFPILLWQKMLTEFENLQIPREASEIYIQTIVQNFIQFQGKALTGPLKRKDFETIQKNLQALDKDLFKNVYQAFVQSERLELQ